MNFPVIRDARSLAILLVYIVAGLSRHLLSLHDVPFTRKQQALVWGGEQNSPPGALICMVSLFLTKRGTKPVLDILKSAEYVISSNYNLINNLDGLR
jgi:hypothetical protein